MAACLLPPPTPPDVAQAMPPRQVVTGQAHGASRLIIPTLTRLRCALSAY